MNIKIVMSVVLALEESIIQHGAEFSTRILAQSGASAPGGGSLYCRETSAEGLR